MLKCAHCDKLFKYESERKRHQESHFPQFGCTVCAKKFSFLSALRRHQKQHKRKGSVQCDECGGSFRDDILLKRHMQYAHTGTYCCLECSTTLSSEQALRTHSKIHKPESERRYRCTFEGCKKSFNFPHHLKHHELSHTNAKQHFCNVCGKGFIQSHHLKTHLKSHHAEDWFFCSVCNTKFTTKYALNKHMNTHNRSIGVNYTEIKGDSGISSDSNSANDIHDKDATAGDNVLCATCGKLIRRLQYLNHTLKCTSAPKEYLQCNDLKDALPNYDSNLENRDSLSETYPVTPGNYTIDAKVGENCMSSFTEIYHYGNISEQKNAVTTNIKDIFEMSKDNVKENVVVGCACAHGRSLPISRNLGNAFSLKSKALYSSKNNNMPEIEYREDGIVKIKETLDADIVVVTREAPKELRKVNNEFKDLKFVPFNSCKAVLGNCIVSEDGSVGESCLCARMTVDEQHMSSQEIEELTPNPNAVWV